MKKIYFLFFILAALQADAQQTPQFTQFVFNQFAHHPAVAGSKSCLDMRIGFRTQWVGYDGRPITTFANAHAQILSRKTKHLRVKHGIGGHVESDNTGPTSRTKLYLAYAYHIPVGRKSNLAFGLYGGLIQYRFNAAKVTLGDANDPAIESSSPALIWPDLSPGIWLYSDEFFGGLTLWHALKNKIKNMGTDSRLGHHYVLTAGKRFKATDEISIIPSVALKYAAFSSPAIDINLMMDFENIFQVGLSYRNTDAIAGMFKLNFLKHFSLGYAFDFTTSRIRTASSNTHEIILGISACPHKDRGVNDCPVWN
jgi:type IX secretion system PorP/SprF family membrane protein